MKPEQLTAGIKLTAQKLTGEGLSPEESLLRIGQEFDDWIDRSNLELNTDNLETLLESADWPVTGGKTKFDSYRNLVDNLSAKFEISRRDAVIVLSQLLVMLSMAQEFRASPARIVNLVRHPSARTSINWKMVDVILKEFEIKIELDKEKVAELIENDKKDSARELADSNIEALLETLTAQAIDLDLEQGFQDGLRSLFAPRNGESFVPYLQTLLYIAIIDHFFDHSPEFLYTFKPRGIVALDIFATFPSSLAPGGNPILNNFKAVDRLTSDWAESRDENREQAKALIEIVKGLGLLAHSPRRQMSRSIRMGIIRYIEIKTPADIQLEPQTSLEKVKTFLKKVCERETGTRGIIEQRVADFFGAFDHTDPKWRPRGLGDPVNATNSSSGKLGDCDFQNVLEKLCESVEAHAGRLTDVYVHEHLRTLHLNLPKRLKEWQLISDATAWVVKIKFFVHQDARSERANFRLPACVESIEVVRYIDHYTDLLRRLEQKPREAINLFNLRVIVPLNASNTPIAVKGKAKDFLT